MLQVLPLVLTIMLLLMVAPASAIPICPSGTMADCIGFGSTGCNVNALTFLNFSYSGSVRIFTGQDQDFFGVPLIPAPPPSAISVRPRSNVSSLGSGGAALQFTPPGYGSFVDSSFEVFARTGPGLVGDTLSADLRSVADLQSGSIAETAVPGGSLRMFQGVGCFFDPDPESRALPPFCANPTSLSLPFTRFQEIHIAGSNVDRFEAGFATPEPTTLLLAGTGAAGVGLVRWVKRRRSAV